MKVVEIQDEWAIDNLTLTERHDLEVGPGEVLLQMKASSLNYRDLVVPRRGYGRLTGTLPPHTDLRWRWRGYSDR